MCADRGFDQVAQGESLPSSLARNRLTAARSFFYIDLRLTQQEAERARMQHRASEQRDGRAPTMRSAEAGAPPAQMRNPPGPLSTSGGNSARGAGPPETVGVGASPDVAAKRARLADAADARARAVNRNHAVENAIDLTGTPGAYGISDGAGGTGFFGASGPALPHQLSAGVAQRANRAARGEAVVRSGSGTARAEISAMVESMRLRRLELPQGYSTDGNHNLSEAGPARDPTVDIDARAAEMSLEALVNVVQREDGRVAPAHRAAAEKAIFIKIGDMDDTERSERERDADDVAIRTLKAIWHRLRHRGLKMLVNAYISQIGSPGTDEAWFSNPGVSRATRRRQFLTSHVGFEARRKMSGRKPPG